MFPTIHIIPKLNALDDPRVKKVTAIIKAVAKETGKLLVTEDKVNHLTLLMAVGGDGTMLKGIRLASQTGAVVMGINLGKLGFLTDFVNDDNLRHEMENVLVGGYHVESRMLVKWQDHIATNEFMIGNRYNEGIIKYKLCIGNMEAGEHEATALIIGTPTGSTAYSLSCGGGIIMPSLDVIQIIPLAPLSLISRPLIVPADTEIKISVQSNHEVCIRADGQIVDCPIDTSGLIFKNEGRRARVLHNPNWNFFEMLSTKLGWKNKS